MLTKELLQLIVMVGLLLPLSIIMWGLLIGVAHELYTQWREK